MSYFLLITVYSLAGTKRNNCFHSCIVLICFVCLHMDLHNNLNTAQHIFISEATALRWAMASLFARFLDHTQRRTTVGRTPLDEWSALSRNLYLTTHNIHNRQTSMSPVGFEPAIPASERPQTHVLDRAATEIGYFLLLHHLMVVRSLDYKTDQCFSNRVPQSGNRDSERRKCLMEAEIYWRSQICVYELKFLWRHSTLIIPSLTARWQSIAASIQKLPDSLLRSVSTVRHKQSMRSAKRSVLGLGLGYLLIFFTYNVHKE